MSEPTFTDYGPPYAREVNKRTFGKKRSLGCECTFRFTCRACLLAALGWWRPS